MADLRLTNLANIMVTYSTQVKPGDYVAILMQPPALPLAEEVYRQVLAAGGYPYLLLGGLRSRVETEHLAYILYTQGNDDQIRHVNRFEKIVREEFDVMIIIESQTNTRGLTSVDPARQRLRAQAYADLTRTYQQRSAAGELRWVLTVFPTDAYAQEADMSLMEFEEYVYSTTYADTEDPIAAWQAIHDEQQRLVDWLRGKERVQVKGPNVDLELSIQGRAFINSDGTHNRHYHDLI
jgi:aminopeptidase